jgi:competence protein ComEA
MLSRFMTRREQFILAFLALSLAAGSVAMILKSDEPVDEAHVIRMATGVPPRASIIVAFEGAVREPGLYDFLDGDRVDDGIREAGGLSEDADPSLINLAARLMDGTTLTVPKNGDTEFNIPSSYLKEFVGESDVADQRNTDSRININTATQAMLETLPGVGPTYSSAILEFRAKRPFQSIEDLKNVDGIGPKRYEALKDLVTVQ